MKLSTTPTLLVVSIALWLIAPLPPPVRAQSAPLVSQSAQRVPVTSVASVTEVHGDVEVQTSGKGSFHRLKRHDKVNPGDIVQTGKETRSKVMLLFGDGSKLKLMPATQIELYPYYKGARSAFILFRVIQGGVQPKHIQAGSIGMAKDSILTGAS